ncbi:MAG: hypothetical protein K0Q79_3077 [Flavipsychrobacter sp.]|jgi:hypothetical protein|nr:hypothetical protein [Flavipsychrobacter sp.]
MKQLFTFFKNIYGLTAGIGVAIPGFSYFIQKSPPLFPGIALIVSALCMGLLVHFVKNRKTASTKRGWWLMVLAIACLVSYLLLFDYTTVTFAGNNTSCLQIGFGLSDWSITDKARHIIASKLCGNAKEDILLCVSITRENVFVIWPRWSVYGAGILLMVLFTLSSLAWVSGWGLLGLAYISKNKNDE